MKITERRLRCALQVLSLATMVSCLCPSLTKSEDAPRSPDRRIDFVKDVQPILSKHCWSCHGDQKHESGLRLSDRKSLLQGGDSGKAVIPGMSAQSRLIQLISSTNPKTRMPPDGEGKALAADEIEVLRAWIDAGCQWPESAAPPPTKIHWAYRPLHPSAPPTVTTTGWDRHPIDQFVAFQMARHQLTPSPIADRSTLIRRLSLDLLGLLPSIAEVDGFVQDSRPEAYEELVDRLLDSPRFGERWGRHWLDFARYADSDGYEKDNPRPDAYRWRDWVIDAINCDMPFDQFTIEQLAGDLLPEATPLQKLATAFHRQTLTNTEGGADQEQFRVEACFDRTETTGAVWLGLTVGCARCHSHKYDAISQREYYQLFSVFNNGDESTMTVPKSPEDVAAYGPIKAAHDAAVAQLMTVIQDEQTRQHPEYLTWEQMTQQRLTSMTSTPITYARIENAQFKADSDVTSRVQDDGSILVGGANPDRVIYTIEGRLPPAEFHAVRLDVLPDPALPANGPGRVAHGNFVLSEISVEASPSENFDPVRKLEFSSAKADFEQGDKPWKAEHAIDGKDGTGWAIAPQFGKPHWAVFTLKEPLKNSEAVYLRIRLSHQYGSQHTIGRFRISMQSGLEPDLIVPETIAKIIVLAADQRTEAQKSQLLNYYSSLQPVTKDLLAKLEELKKKEPPKPEVAARVLVQRTSNPRKTYVLKRGDFLEPMKDLEVEPAGLGSLPPMKARQSDRPAPDRLDLARWLVDPDNPLTPRVTVNHVWRQLFGYGIVRTVNDFGVRGDPPTHPELLDWLAAEFIGKAPPTAAPLESSGRYRPGAPWSRKSLIKRIVMSSTYRQSSGHRPDLHERDPQNFWLARQNRLRVEGEIIRDISLQVAGLLSNRIGGPSVFPPLPPGIAELSYAGNFNWTVSKNEDRYRRGMYTFFKRTAPHPNLTTFDCPDANLTCLERRSSNTPLQALTVLNNETFVDAARALTGRLLASPNHEDEARLTEGFRLCVSRPLASGELQDLKNLLRQSREWYGSHLDAARKLIGDHGAIEGPIDDRAAWIATTRILLNLDEFITRD